MARNSRTRTVCQVCQLRRHLGYNLSPCVIYLPRPFSPLFLSERGLCAAAEFYLPLSQRQRATQRREGAKRRVFVFGRTTGEMAESSGLPPLRRAVAFYGGGLQREGGVERRRRKRHQYEYSSCVGNVVHCILTNQGVNMTLAQKPTVHRVRERN